VSADFSQKRVVLFDAGGVLVYPNWSEVAHIVHERTGRSLAVADLHDAENHAMNALEGGAVLPDQDRWTVFMSAVLRRAGLDGYPSLDGLVFTLKDVHNSVSLWTRVAPDARATLSRLAGYRLGVVSNANGVLKRKLQRLDLFRFFDVVLDSHEEGVEKPNPEIFRRALERLGADASQAVHVGDVENIDVAGALAAGITPIFLARPGAPASDRALTIRSLSELPGLLTG
jgi:putative hydrolase of the HAD superfamily